jgi:transposase
LLEPTVAAEGAASLIFNLPDYRVTATVQLPDGARHVTVESMFPPGCPGCGVIASQVKERRCQRLPDLPVAGAVVLLWDKRPRRKI